MTFEQGTDPDTAQVQVQNKIQQAESRLPSEVQQTGVTVEKSQSNFLLIAAVYDTTDKASSSDIADWLVSNVQDPLARVEGVGSLQGFGAEYAMRIWLDPAKLASYSLMPSDVQSAIEAQNVQVTAGKIGALPSPNTQQLTATVRAQSRLQTVDQFKNIIVKSQSDGAVVRIKDVARVEMGSEDYTAIGKLNGHPSAGVAVMLSPGANALNTATLVKDKIAEFQRNMPQGYDIAYPKDSTEFIKISVEDVIQTLFEAIVLVVCVMYLFLQNLRATLIPALAVPVVLLGTFGVLPQNVTVHKGEVLFPRIDMEKEIDELNSLLTPAKTIREDEDLDKANVITIDQFAEVKLRSGEITACEKIKKAKKLLKLTVDDGRNGRQIVSGIANWYQPEDLIGRKIVFVANLAPAKLCGELSEGMILACDAGDNDVRVLFLDKDVPNGSTIR